MKKRRAVLLAAVTFFLLMLIGWALARSGDRVRQGERRERARRVVAQRAELIEEAVADLLLARSVHEWVERANDLRGIPAELYTLGAEADDTRWVDILGPETRLLASHPDAERPVRVLLPPELLTGLVVTRALAAPAASGGPPVAAVVTPFRLVTPSPLGIAFATGFIVVGEPLAALLERAELQQLRTADYDYSLVQTRPLESGVRVLARSRAGDLDAPETYRLALPAAEWLLSATPVSGWNDTATVLAHLALTLLLSLIASYSVHALASRPLQLADDLETQSELLHESQRKLLEEIQLRQRIEAQVAFNSSYDPLTGLPNREHLLDRMRRALESGMSGPGHRICAAFFGVDRFKTVNETLGHEAGDALLRDVASRLDRTLQPSDTLARIGGDRFAALLFEVRSEEEAMEFARRVSDAMRPQIQIGEHEVFTTVSLGLALSGLGFDRPEEVLKQAEMAMYRAKQDGRGESRVFDPSLADAAATELQLETDLRRAIDRDEFLLYYQPIIDLASGAIAGLEVLVRWQHPLDGVVAPGLFIGLAEETGMIVPIDRIILRRACEQMATWRQDPLFENIYFSVNLSGKDIAEPDLTGFVAGVQKENGLPPGVLRLEVTEGVLMSNPQEAFERLSRLRRMKVPLLLDDFGTGYSSLSYLHRFDFDILKIDRSFVSRIQAGGKEMGLVRGIVDLSRNLGMKTVAEGVENAQDVVALRELGCDFGQGYFFGRPVPAEPTEKLIRSAPSW